jgi:hypothetical protein
MSNDYQPQPNHPHDHDDEASYEEKVEKLVGLTVAAVKEIVPPGQVRMLLLQIANSTAAPPEIRNFTHVLLKLLSGDRDQASLIADLPDNLALAVEEAITRIEAPLPTDQAEEAEGLTFEALLERVAEACQGNMIIWQQLWNFTEDLEKAETTPPAIRNLAVVLRKILAGERQPHVTDTLPAELAAPVNDLLTWLRQQSASPPSS